MFLRKKLFWIVTLLVVLIACAILAWSHFRTAKAAYEGTVSIILSPHYDDAVLSLGGLMAKHQHPIFVATFFTAVPDIATTTSWDTRSGFRDSTGVEAARKAENDASLKMFGASGKDYRYFDNQYGHGETDAGIEADLTKDIQALIASYSGKTIDVYGPAYFGPDITHPDHLLLHRAFLDVARNYPDKKVSFYIYEDFPYVDNFNKSSVSSLEKNLEIETGLLMAKESVALSSGDVNKKIEGIKKYDSQVKAFTSEGDNILDHARKFTGTRCGIHPDAACETVYRLSAY